MHVVHQVLNFNDIKWEEKNFITGNLASLTGISANAVEIDGVVCIGLADKYTLRIYFCIFLQILTNLHHWQYPLKSKILL